MVKKKNILVVEDDEMYSMFLTHYLDTNLGNVNINVCQTGAEGLRQIKTAQPDVVILDYYLDDTNGMEILKTIKRLYPGIIVIVLSAQKKIETAVELLKEGAHAYLEKNPDSSHELLQSLEEAFEAQNASKIAVVVNFSSKNKAVRYAIIALVIIVVTLLILNLT